MAEAGGGVFEMSADFVTYDDIPWDRQKPEAQKQHSDNTWSDSHLIFSRLYGGSVVAPKMVPSLSPGPLTRFCVTSAKVGRS
jgi:hypothetical protein